MNKKTRSTGLMNHMGKSQTSTFEIGAIRTTTDFKDVCNSINISFNAPN